MNLAYSTNALLSRALFALLLFCPLLYAQAGGSGAAEVAAPPRITPIRVAQSFELGTDLEQFATYPNVLLERRESPVPDVVWRIGPRATVVPTSIVLTDVLGGADRRIGARLDYRASADAGGREGRASVLIDYNEVEQLESVLMVVIRALTQASPAKDETIACDYVTKGGFRIAFSITPGPSGPVVDATAGPARETSRERAIKMFDDCRVMVHALIQNLASK